MEAASSRTEQFRRAQGEDRDMERLPEWISFIQRRSLLASVCVIVTFVIAAGDLLEIIPAAEPIVGASWFEYFHQVHDILALAFVVFVGYRWSTQFGAILLFTFLLAHLPYFALTFPGEASHHLRLFLEVLLGTWFMVTIDRLHRAAASAENAAMVSGHVAMHDTLTDLPNRALFQEEAQRTMASAVRRRSNFAILFVDLDNFKDINDTLGHAMGDQLLLTVSERLLAALRDGDIVARLGGDEFAIIAKDLEQPENAAYLAERLIELVSEPIIVDGHKMHTSPSIGIAPYPCMAKNEEVTDFMQLLRHADMAMYRAKSNGRRTFEFYDHEMSVDISEKIAVLNDLRYAIEKRQLLLHYQPQYDIRAGRLVGAEALIRWNHPERGLVPPDDFIPAAETSGLIIPIGEWVLKTAAEQNRAWQDAGLHPIKINVNLSPVQLHRQPIVPNIKRILEQAGLEPKYVDLELTENVLMEDAEFSAKILSQLRELGVSLSIDDFGTGYSSLNCLQEFSVDTLKIDKAFVKDIKMGSDTAAIAEAVIKLGHSLGMNVIAEGVEKESEMKLLRGMGCDQGQGFFFSRPVPAAQFTELLEESTRNKPTGSSKLSVEFY